jgi:hypothetical protein
MLGGQFRGRIRAKPEVSKLGTLKKPTNVATLKKEAQAKVGDVLGKPKKSLLQETKADVKKAAQTEAIRVEQQKKAEEVKKRGETSKVLSSESFLNKLSSVLGIKKDALKVKSRDEIVADTNAKINELKETAVKNAKTEAELAKNIKLESNKSILNQKITDLNERITGLKNNFFNNINNILVRSSPPNRIRDNESGRIDRIRALDAEAKAKRLKDSDTKDRSGENDQRNKTDTSKDDADIIPLERSGRLGDDSVNVKRKSKDAEDEANKAAESDKTKNEKNENDSSTRAKDDTRKLDNPKRGLESDDTRVKAKKAEDDAKNNKDGDENTKNKTDDESKKTEKAKDDSDDLANPRRELDSENVKKKAKDADDDATKSKDGDAEGKKKDSDERNKTDEAETNAKKLKDTDDSKKVREDAESQRKRDSEDNKKVKDENSKLKKTFDGLNKLSNLLGLIGTTLSIVNIITPPLPPLRSFCELNPNSPLCIIEPPISFCQLNPRHPSCTSICVGPLCSFTIQPPQTFDPTAAPPPARFSLPPFPDINGVLSYLLFTIQKNPENDVKILLEPNDENIKFVDTTIVFPKDKWDTTIKIPFYISVPDLSENEEFESMPLEDQVGILQEKPRRPKIQKDTGSLRDYYPSIQEINSLARRLKYLLDTSDTDLEKALQEIQENIRIKRQLGIYKKNRSDNSSDESDNSSVVEPTYSDSEYEELKEDIIPTLDDQTDETNDEENSSVVEPTYSDSEYEEVKEDVEPTEYIKPSRMRAEFEPLMVTQDGGQEEGEEGEDSSELLSDDYKAYFTMRIIGDVKVPFDIEVISESPIYQTDPDIVSFGLQTQPSENSNAPSESEPILTNEIAVFSSETFNIVKNTLAVDDAYERTEEFNKDVNNEYVNNYENILEEREYADANADDLYDSTYNRSLSNTNRQISEAEYLRNQLVTGGKQRYYTRKK